MKKSTENWIQKKAKKKNANYIITYIVRHLGFSCFGNNSFFYYDDDDDDYKDVEDAREGKY